MASYTFLYSLPLNSEMIGASGTKREFVARFPIMASGGSLYASYIWPRTLKNVPTVTITKIDIDFYGSATGEIRNADKNSVWIKITPPSSLQIENFNVYMGTIGLSVEFK